LRILSIGNHPPTIDNRLGVRGLAVIVMCCAFWGANTVAVKFTVQDVPPLGCAGFRFLLALPFLAVAGLRNGGSLRLRPEDVPPILLNGFFTFLQIGTFNWGASLTLAGRATVLINSHPFVVAPLAWLFLGEGLRWHGWLGLILAAGGMVWLFQEPLQSAEGSLRGDALMLLSAFILGCQAIYLKQVLGRLRVTTLLFWQTFVLVPLFFLASGLWEGFANYRLTLPALIGLAYQGLIISGMCFLIWLRMVQRYSVSLMMSFGFLTPIFGVLAGNLMRHEPVTVTLAGSTALVGLGIYLVAQARVIPTTLPGDAANGKADPV
jgi:drug/metabolite transporter (DMT)-like permease